MGRGRDLTPTPERLALENRQERTPEKSNLLAPWPKTSRLQSASRCFSVVEAIQSVLCFIAAVGNLYTIENGSKQKTSKSPQALKNNSRRTPCFLYMPHDRVIVYLSNSMIQEQGPNTGCGLGCGSPQYLSLTVSDS